MTSTRNPKMKCGIVALARWMGSAHRPGGLRRTRAAGGRAHRSPTSSTAIPGAFLRVFWNARLYKSRSP
jgi:hypothetical protein